MKKEKAELLKKIHGGQTCQIVATAAKLGIFDELSNGPLTARMLAEKLPFGQVKDPSTQGVSAPFLERLLYALVALFLLELSEETHTFSLTPQGAYLTESHEESLKAIAIYKGDPLVWDALGKLYDGILTGVDPQTLAHGKPLFDYLSENPESMEVFQYAMDCYTIQSSSVLLQEYPFSTFQTLLDVGGGSGAFATKIREVHPTLSVTTFDLPQTIRFASKWGVKAIPGSFFDEIPPGYDAYILRNILHDWPDDKCIQILQNIRKAMSQDTTLLVIEAIVDPKSSQRLGKFADITMMIMTRGGKERSLDEFTALFLAAGLTLSSVTRTTGSKALLAVHISSA